MSDENRQLEDMERLFLLELLVDSVQVNYEKIGMDACEISTLKQACVRFQFLNYPVLEICEEDFCNIPDDYTKDQIQFKSGKSCLFSLRGIPPDVRNFEISVTVLRQKTTGSCALLGRTRICLGSSFTNILTAMDNDCSSSPLARTSKDTHPLLNEKAEIVGKITVFVRLSCFGKMIITQFQVSGEENKSFLFKGASETKALSDIGGLGDQVNLHDPFVRGAPGGDTSEGSRQARPPTTASQGPMSAGLASQGYYPGTPDPYSSMQGGPMGGALGMSGDMGGQGMESMVPGSMPRTPGSLPGNMTGTLMGMPGSMPGMPGSMQGMPGNMQSMPGNMQSMPGNMSGMPGNMTGTLPGMEGMPGTMVGMAGIMPGSMPGLPGSISAMPVSMPGMPGSMSGMAGMPGMFGLAGAMPGCITGEGDEPPGKNYKEIGVEINGHSLSIKIPRREKKPKSEAPEMPFCGKMPFNATESSSESSEEEGSAAPQQQTNVAGIDFCGCDYPLPPGFGSPPPPAPPKKKKKKKKPKCPLEIKGNYCMKPDCPMGYPQLPSAEKRPGCPQFETPAGAVGVKGEQILFQMPTGHEGNFPGNTQALYNLGGNMDTNLQKVQMMDDMQAGKNVVPNPENDVFLLKVGKKNVETDRRAKMQVELKSPRKVEKKMVEEATQYLEADVGPVADKKGAAKGGKGKGKGKGKGGKGGKGKKKK